MDAITGLAFLPFGDDSDSPLQSTRRLLASCSKDTLIKVLCPPSSGLSECLIRLREGLGAGHELVHTDCRGSPLRGKSVNELSVRDCVVISYSLPFFVYFAESSLTFAVADVCLFVKIWSLVLSPHGDLLLTGAADELIRGYAVSFPDLGEKYTAAAGAEAEAQGGNEQVKAMKDVADHGALSNRTFDLSGVGGNRVRAPRCWWR